MTSRMLPIDLQKANEWLFARAHIDGYIRDFLKSEQDIIDAVAHGVELLEEYRNKTYGYESKNTRMGMVRDLELEPIVWEIFVASAYAQIPELFSSFVGKIAGVIGFSDRVESATTVGEMIAVLCETNVYDLFQEGKYAPWKLSSNIELPEKLLMAVDRSAYMPPHVRPIPKLIRNKQALKETCAAESMILNNNHHSEDICLDVLNSKNSTALCLNTEFLSTVEEEPNAPLETREQMDNWLHFKRQSHEMYKLMVAQGNCFYMEHKIDKRGRIYAQGYHINYQGAPYKKAMVDLYNKEVVEGVPEELRIQ